MMLHGFLSSRNVFSVVVLAAGLLVPAVLWAGIQEVSVSPPQPTTCDSVTLNVSGYFTDGCWHYDGYTVNVLPTMTPSGPAVTVISVRVLCHNTGGQGCPLVIVPYDISHVVAALPAGQYLVSVDEVDSGQIDVVYDHKEFAFTVGLCELPPECVIPSFGPQHRGCNAVVAPGAPGLFYLTLNNLMSVAGAEMVIDGFLQFRDLRCGAGVRCGYDVAVTRVEPVGRAEDMGLEWKFSEGRLHVMLHPLAGTNLGGLGVIEPGEGPIARVVIETTVDSIIPLETSQGTPEFEFLVTLNPVAFADENANPIAVCPTFAPITGTICVRSAQKCDVNGDGTADVVDIVRMINCIMCPIPEGCCTADETARGDCNGDGVLNVTDVVCCIRHILGSLCSWCGGETAPPAGAEPASVGLAPEPEWETSTSFSLPISLSSASALGGVEMRLAYDPALLSVEGVEVEQGARNGSAYFSASDGELSVMVVAQGAEPLPAYGGTFARVSFSLVGGASAEETIVSLVGAAGASASGTRLDLTASNSRTEIRTPSSPALASRPNPFLGSTEISLYLDSGQTGSLRVYDAHGRLISSVFDGPLPAGPHTFEWNGRDVEGREVPSGVYFLKFEGGAKSLSKKVVLLRR